MPPDHVANSGIQPAPDREVPENSRKDARKRPEGMRFERIEETVCKNRHRDQEVRVFAQLFEVCELVALFRPRQRSEAYLETSLLQLNDEIIDRLSTCVADVRIRKVRCDNEDRLHAFHLGHKKNQKRRTPVTGRPSGSG